MSLRRTHPLSCALIATLILVALIVPVTVFAQDATPQPTLGQETPAGALATPGTPTLTDTPAPTNTPAPTPTATPTFTARPESVGAGPDLSGRS